MNSLRKTLRYILRKETPVMLGRWKIDYCQTQIANKVDMSNEDHCGPCGQYTFKKIQVKQTLTSTNINKVPVLNPCSSL